MEQKIYNAKIDGIFIYTEDDFYPIPNTSEGSLNYQVK